MTQARARAVDVIVVGGGIAGLSAAALLAGRASVLLLERESQLASHASGRNAAIYRPLEDDDTSGILARRSLTLLAELELGPVLSRTGLLLTSSEADGMRDFSLRAQQQNVANELLGYDDAVRAEPSLAHGDTRSALWLEGGGVFDNERLTAGLADAARARGAQLRTGVAIAGVVVRQGRVHGVTLRNGETLVAAHVVLCAGAWAAELGGACSAPLQLTPFLRHLVRMRSAQPVQADRPVVWRVHDELYYRPLSGDLLVSPCDELPWPAEQSPRVDPNVLATVTRKLQGLAPQLAAATQLESWACLRTFATDRELVAGSDPRLSGLHWLVGLGGRGMSVAPAAAELLVAGLLGDAPSPLSVTMSPARFC